VTSPEMTPFTYVSAAYDMLKVGDKARSLAFLETASHTWPTYWLSYFLIANYYLEQNDNQAVAWFEKGYEVGQHQHVYVHNYVLALRENNMPEKANTILKQGLERFPNNEPLLTLAEK
ncbi:peptidase C39, partial [Alteromonas sp. MCA-1]|uniref:tetratricopeptide repeat protein n=2 Tax=Alteromonas TaxID=226 RepID=UPI003FA43F07|nr:peptidase C39 [Alteromonas sp. MCA-1]